MIENMICINCGHKVSTLFKRYSASVLKLTDCDNCEKTADKYVEYDVVIIIIDLILLRKSAYRHVIFNVDFPNFWKLSVILLLMEAYVEWSYEFPSNAYNYKVSGNNTGRFLDEVDIEFQFYKPCLYSILKSGLFLMVLFIFTHIYAVVISKTRIGFMNVWKTLTVSSFGIFLLLPSLIWDSSFHHSHLSVVSLYTTMSQLLAYTALCNCPKIWSIVAIFSAYYCKSILGEYLHVICIPFL